MNSFTLDVDAAGIATLVFDVPGRSMNTFTLEAMEDLAAAVARIRIDTAIKGVVVASGKASGFCAGADLEELGARLEGGTAADAFALVHGFTRSLRELETCGKPVAAAIEGLALGGGFELALACHHRVVGDDPKVRLGLPEGKLGLMPGAGGTQRVPRLIGVMASGPLLLEGKALKPKEALGLGLIHAVVPAGEAQAAARAWIEGGGKPGQPWDASGYKIPGGAPYHPQGAQVFMVGTAMMRKSTFGAYPAQLNMLRAVYEGLQLPMDAALRVESRWFVRTLMTPEARAMTRTLFTSLQALNKGSALPAAPAAETRKAAVLGAGMMGAGIAYVQALAGIETVLIDVDQAAADRGKDHARTLLDKGVRAGRLTREAADAALARIEATPDYGRIQGADLVIEAVFEDRALKAEATRRAEAELAAGAVFGSNTSTLPITGLAEASVRPERYLGVHFFSPVDRMPLVEVIRGERTGDEAVARAVDYALKLKKTPIVVRDGRGFYTSRCFMTYLDEGVRLFAEGVAPALIDNVGRMTAMPRGPLEMADDVALDLAYKIVRQTAADLGSAYDAGPIDAVLEAMVAQLGRHGRKNGKGFYDYPEGGAQKRLWPGLSGVAAPTITRSSPELVRTLKLRLLYRQAVEAARCMAEGVVADPRDADVGAILGWGFAPWSGGPLSLIDTVGPASFVATCDALAAEHGPRFAPPQSLRAMAAEGRGFYGPATEGRRPAALAG